MGTCAGNTIEKHCKPRTLDAKWVQPSYPVINGVSMTRAALLAIIFSGPTATLAIAVNAATDRNRAQKGYKAALAKIRSDDSAATEQCRSGTGPAVEACLVQARGKRMRAEQEAKKKADRAGQIPSLPKAEAKAASTEALRATEDEERSTLRNMDSETKAAGAECKKLTGAARKSCNAGTKRATCQTRCTKTRGQSPKT